jgi:ATP-dependent DNA helicase RecQ
MAQKRTPEEKEYWQRSRRIVWARDAGKCTACGMKCESGEGHVHHLNPFSISRDDSPSNLVLLCVGCHASRHPLLQASLGRGFIERWALRLAKWLDWSNSLPDKLPDFGGILRLLGVERFRQGQLEIVLEALKRRSILVVRPTGSGKSLCFQIPALMKTGTTYVVAPLNALMSDQIAGLTEKKIPATFVNSQIYRDERELRLNMLDQGAWKLFYCAPERFNPKIAHPNSVKRVMAHVPAHLVVDEAHCIDKWGTDFRPAYGDLGDVKEKLGNPPVLAFTATAGVKTQERIIESLRIPDARVFVSGFDRPNISLVRIPLVNSEQRYRILTGQIRKLDGKAMIFVPTKKDGKRVCQELKQRGFDVPFYHAEAGTPHEKDVIMGRFSGRLSPPAPTIVCTNAAGMGLDIEDIRLVVHWHYPGSVEDYMQEVGRAGRDGKPAMGLLFVGDRGVGVRKFMAEKTVEQAVKEGKLSQEHSHAVLQAKYDAIDEFAGLATSRWCFRRQLLEYFEGAARKTRTPLSLRILQWVFGRKQRVEKNPHCCDSCNPWLLSEVGYERSSRRYRRRW